MATVQGASAHRWVPSVLLLSALAACGGAKMAVAPGAYAPSSAPPGMAPIAAGPAVAHSGGGAPGMAAEPSHIGVERQVVMGEDPAPAIDRPGLGTTWGEQVSAPISFSPFVRAGSQPWAEAVLHYNDAPGLAAHASYLGAAPQPLEVFAGDGAISIALTDEAGRTLRGYEAGGRAIVVGNDGDRYRIVVRNGTTARFEVVASVDGLDVIDGNPADPNRRGYIIDPHGVLVIDGFRTSDSSVAAFRFGKVADSYAAQTSGDRNVGVVGFAIFAERGAVWSPAELQRRDTANPFPQRGYAVPPR